MGVPKRRVGRALMWRSSKEAELSSVGVALPSTVEGSIWADQDKCQRGSRATASPAFGLRHSASPVVGLASERPPKCLSLPAIGLSGARHFQHSAVGLPGAQPLRAQPLPHLSPPARGHTCVASLANGNTSTRSPRARPLRA